MRLAIGRGNHLERWTFVYFNPPTITPSPGNLMIEAEITSNAAATHAEETLASVLRLHAEHKPDASSQQRAVARFAEVLGRPGSLVVLAAVVGVWICANSMAPFLGYAQLDHPPFPWLQGILTLASLFAVILVLGAQRLEDELNRQRALLELELTLLSEQKTAKVIQLLEEFRRDSPNIRDRFDAAAESMSEPSDPHSVIKTIKETQAADPALK
jgi:uncharacterized membrane protein